MRDGFRKIWKRACATGFAFALTLVLLCVPHAAKALLNNGENAVDILGEYSQPWLDTTGVYTRGCPNGGASPLGFDGLASVAIDPVYHRLFTAESYERVLAFTLTSSNVLTSANKSAANVMLQPNFVSCNGFFHTQQMAYDSTNNRLYMGTGDFGVLAAFNTSTLTNGMSYAYTIATEGLSATTMEDVEGVAYDPSNNLLYAADGNGNRIMVYNMAAIANNETASYVLGQSSFTAGNANQGGSAGQNTLSNPKGLAIDSTNHLLYVADYNNNRVMVFPAKGHASWTGNNENALYVLGQANFTTTGGNTTATGMQNPLGLAFDATNNRLFVTDSNANNRVLIFNTASISSGMSATYALGNTDLVGDNPGSVYSFLNGIGFPAYDATNSLLYVPSPNDDRILIFNVAPPPTLTATATAQTGDDACAVGSSGNLYCWGVNYVDQDGLGNSTQYIVPQEVGIATNWTAVAAGHAYNANNSDTCGIAGGALYCWGINQYGEDGHGNTKQYIYPQQVGTDTTWTAISQSADDACGIDSGKLYCWGANWYGEVGNGLNYNKVFVTTATTTGSFGGVSGADSTCASAATGASLSGTFKSWTAVTTGTDDPNTTYTQPQQSMDPFAEVNGTVVAYNWSNLISGTLINGINLSQTGGTVTGSAWTNVTAGSGKANHSTSSATLNCAAWTNATATDKGNVGTINSTATAWSSGAATQTCSTANHLYCFQQDAPTNEQNSPVQIGSATNWTAISTGGEDTCGIAGGKLYCWGHNLHGELGLGNTTEFATPQQVGTDTTWTAISQGDYDTCGVDNGKLYCWGWNNGGEDGQGNTTQITSPAQVGSATNWTAVSVRNQNNTGADTCGLAGGKLYCWGINNNGQDGVGTTTQNTSPVQVGTHTTWTAISMGEAEACGIDNNQLYCWGSNSNGSLGINNETQQTAPAPVTIGGTLTGTNAVDEMGQYTGPNSTTVAWAEDVQYYERQAPYNGPTALGFNFPTGVALDPAYHNLFVSDGSNNRIMVFPLSSDNSISTASGGHSATYALGQGSVIGDNYTTSGAGQSTLWGPTGLAVDPVNNRLFEVDTTLNRVMIFGTASFSNNQNATGVLGVPDFGAHNGSCTSTTMNGPLDDAYDSINSRLFVSDALNNRVLVFASFTNGAAASSVLGQTSFTASSANRGGSAAAGTLSINANNLGLNNAGGVAYDPVNNRLFVGDTGNNRVLVFNTSSITNGESASYVLGQTTMTGTGSGVTATTMNRPEGVAYDPNNSRLFVADFNNDRVLVFNVSPSAMANGMKAVQELGVPAGTSAFTTQGSSTATQSTFQPMRLFYDPGSSRLFVSDSNNNRVLIFDVSYLGLNGAGYE